MKCIGCGGTTRINRVAVNIDETVECGGFCQECEERHFGIHAESIGTSNSECCLLCSRDAMWSLPILEGSPDVSRNGSGPTYEYDLSSANLLLCSYHFHQVTSIPTSEVEGQLADQPPLSRWLG